MVIERTESEIIFRMPGDINIDFLQAMTDLLLYKELTKNSKVKQSEVDDLVKKTKTGRWKSRKEMING